MYQNLADTSEKDQDERVRRHKGQFDKFLKQFDFHNVTYQKVIETGKVHQVILEKAQSMNTQLIVMGASGESENFRVFMGSNTEYVIRKLPSSIITLKSESVIQPMIDYQISDLESHYNLGRQFLENGMSREAVEQFKYCVNQDVLYAPAWDGLALAYQRMDDAERALEYKQKAEHIRKNLWERRVQAEIRSKHTIIGS